LPPIGREVVQDGEREGRGLTSSCLGDPDHVSSQQSNGNGSELDWCRSEVFLFGQGTNDRFGQAEITEGGQYKIFR
jgi:hypothetical protein